MDTEIIATSAVNLEISKTERLSPFVNEKDKEPCWDGNIYIYANKQHSKDNIKRVPVQIKGEAVSRRKVKEHIQYEISAADLTAYKSDGGVIFFVVYIDNKTGEKLQIYYSDLLPEKIKVLLEKDNRKVRFKKFPTSVMKMEDLFLNFYENSRKQVSFSIAKTEPPDAFAKRRDFKGFTFSITSSHKAPTIYELPQYLEGQSLYIYGLLTSVDVPIPVDYIDEIRDIAIAEDVDVPISVNGIKYYDDCKKIFFKDKIILKLGSCVSITFHKDEDGKIIKPIHINFKILGTMSERIKGLKFFKSAMANNGFRFGKVDFNLNIDNGDLKPEHLTKVLNAYEKAQRLLDLLSIKKDLDLDQFNEEDYGALSALIISILDNKLIKSTVSEYNKIKPLKIGNLNLSVVYLPGVDGGYTIVDVFNKHLQVSIRNNETGDTFRVSQFVCMTAEEYLSYDDLNLAFIVEDYKYIPTYDGLYNDATLTALEFIKAYDISQKDNFLDAANDMFDWVDSNNALSRDIMLVNRFQILLRQRPLKYEEKCQLNDLIKSTTDSQIKCCAFLLLDEQEEAKKLLDNFDTALLDRFKSYPIYRFYKAS